jgi:hypothetical protein
MRKSATWKCLESLEDTTTVNIEVIHHKTLPLVITSGQFTSATVRVKTADFARIAENR